MKFTASREQAPDIDRCVKLLGRSSRTDFVQHLIDRFIIDHSRELDEITKRESEESL